jgi:D-aminopeptidase
VGRVYGGAVAAAADADPALGSEIPVVAECDDSWLSDAAPVQAEAGDAAAALADAGAGAHGPAGSAAAADGPGAPVARGAVGAGTGMVCFDWKGGIGTSSRAVAQLGATVGVLVLANFGACASCASTASRSVGRSGAPGDARSTAAPPAGSCIVAVATDTPLGSAQLERVARRAGLGLGSRARARSLTTAAGRSSWRSAPAPTPAVTPAPARPPAA